ncbi:MAG: NADH-quinone oxidoreductase subunit NuoH [Candidatus Sericytochromatia bacterium]|nr:NADH-quinone oxidoreductase subunit NuoH [Candidatus Sericytochromatia bacterium]
MQFLSVLGGALALTGFILTVVIVLIWLERRLIGLFQIRLGPNRVGPGGILQPVADAIKVLLKEDIIPAQADKVLFNIAPVLMFIPGLVIWGTIPFAKGWVVADIRVGLFFAIACGALTSLAILMAGWASNNKYALIGGLRSTAQAISYELPLILSTLGVVMFAGTFNLTEIVEKQHVWYIFLQPLAFIIFFICQLAEVNRTPFDIPEAESELVAGYSTEYSGFKFALFFLAEYVNTFTIGALCAILFLGGWKFPFAESLGLAQYLNETQWLGPIPLPLPVFWFLGKVFAVFALIVWIRATVPRLRADQLMAFAWKFLVPLALLNVFLTGLLVPLFVRWNWI